jgi:protocadherin-16/23
MSTVNVTVTVIDENDNAPQFSTPVPLVVAVPAEVTAGARLVKLEATDADGVGPQSKITYSLVRPRDEFVLDAHTGWLSARRHLSLGSTTRYIEVRASDNGQPSLSTTTVVELRSGVYDDNSPYTVLMRNATLHVNVPETSAAGTPVVRVAASRRNGDTSMITYAIRDGNDRQAFKIDPIVGQIYVSDSTKLDYEEKSVYKLIVDAASAVEANPTDDDRDYVAFTKVIISLTDMNDNAPVFIQQHYTTAVLEGQTRGTFVAQVSAVDADLGGENAHITYSIVAGNTDSAFVIDHAGVIKTAAQLDREIVDDYKLTVMATDGGPAPLTGTTFVDVKGGNVFNYQITDRALVIDTNDNSPSFPPLPTLSISEGNEASSSPCTLTQKGVHKSEYPSQPT